MANQNTKRIRFGKLVDPCKCCLTIPRSERRCYPTIPVSIRATPQPVRAFQPAPVACHRALGGSATRERSIVRPRAVGEGLGGPSCAPARRAGRNTQAPLHVRTGQRQEGARPKSQQVGGPPSRSGGFGAQQIDRIERRWHPQPCKPPPPPPPRVSPGRKGARTEAGTSPRPGASSRAHTGYGTRPSGRRGKQEPGAVVAPAYAYSRPACLGAALDAL